MKKVRVYLGRIKSDNVIFPVSVRTISIPGQCVAYKAIITFVVSKHTFLTLTYRYI